jgi:hypothetical protein
MAKMASLIIKAIDLIVESRKDITYSAQGYEVDFISFIPFFVYILLFLSIVWFE